METRLPLTTILELEELRDDRADLELLRMLVRVYLCTKNPRVESLLIRAIGRGNDWQKEAREWTE